MEHVVIPNPGPGRLIALVGQIPDLNKPRWQWKKDTIEPLWISRTGYVVKPLTLYRQHLGYSVSNNDSTLAVVTDKQSIAEFLWIKGIPTLLSDQEEQPYLAMSLAEALAPYVTHTASLERLLPTVGFRAYATIKLGEPGVPWWSWEPRKATCQAIPTYETHQDAPNPECTCGFHIADEPWTLTDYYIECITYWLHVHHRMLVVAPFGKVFLHPSGARCEHYDIVACVAPLNAKLSPEEIEDPRLVRARNVPFKAWEIAKELAAAAAAGLGDSNGPDI